MNIKITHDWLVDYLETDATPFEIQKYLSLCGPSVEKVTEIGNDYVYDIEVTSNRCDMASVFGIAQEAQAILPQFGKRAELKLNPLIKYKFGNIPAWSDRSKIAKNLKIYIQDKELCSRFTAIILDEVKIKPSPDFMSKCLQLCGIKSINNVVDVSNYLNVALGQPVHVFDYDRIGGGYMKLRESKKGEKITTLDSKQITLPGGDIVIEDGGGKLIDLCGIMGGLNSSVTEKTKTIVLFVQTYNPQKIRRTSMLTGQRTVAATYFEKDLDEERVEPTTAYGVELLQKYAGAQVASQIYDIYPNPHKPSSVKITLDDISRKIGVNIAKNKIGEILTNLGFKYHIDTDRSTMVIGIPSWRSKDIIIKEDIVEEIARIYGYHNLSGNIQPTLYVNQPKDIEFMFDLQAKVKHFLKNLGLNEMMNYSMVAKELIDNIGLKQSDHLRIKNTISEEIEFLRKYIAPSLIKNIKDNEGKKDSLKFFEIAKGYKPRPGDLPSEKYQLAIVTNTDLDDLKGIVEALFRELNIESYKIEPSEYKTLEKNSQAQITIGKDWLGKFGKVNNSVKERFKLKSDVFCASFEFGSIIKYYNPLSSYTSISPYAQIKLDLTIEQTPKYPYSYIKETAFKTAGLLQKIELIDRFKNKITLRFYFSSPGRNITEQQAKKELENIKKMVLGRE